MKSTCAQQCPLCGLGAQYYPVDRRRRKHFLCSTCAQFQISTEAERRLARANAESRAHLSELSKAHPQGATLVITTASTRPSGVPTFAHEYVENSRLPG